MKDDDELGWLDKMEPEDKKEETEDSTEEEVQEEPNTEPEETSEEDVLEIDPPVAKLSLNEIYKRIGDQDFLMSENLNIPTCQKLRNMIVMLVENDGKWLEGRKTMDGFAIQCPIHAYAPMYKCYSGCPHWVGDKNPEGKCTRDLEDIDYDAPKYDYPTAQAMEIKHRQEHSSLATKEEGTEDSE